jgi:hypothetical protein
MTLNVLDDALSWVRSHPERFFAGGRPTEFDLTRMVWTDAVLSGAQQALSLQASPFWVVAASTDWLKDAGVPIEALFAKLLPLAGAGPNSARSEVVLNAFCSEVGAFSQGKVTVVRGGAAIERVLCDVVTSQNGLVGAVAYRL